MAAIPYTGLPELSKVISKELAGPDNQAVFHGWRCYQGMRVPFMTTRVSWDGVIPDSTGVVGERIALEDGVLAEGHPMRTTWLGSNFESEILPRMDRLLNAKKKSFVVGYKNHPALEELYAHLNRKNPGTVVDLTVPFNLWKTLDNKLTFADALERTGIGAPRGEVMALSVDTPYDDLAQAYGKTLVIKDPASTGGGFGVSILADAAMFEEWKQRNIKGDSLRARVEEFDEGIDASMLAVGFADGKLLLGPLNFQLVGNSECTPSSTVWCGNDYSRGQYHQNFAKAQAKAGRDIAKLWQEYFHPMGLVGEFGIDMRVRLESGRVQLGEINPRLTGQTMFLTELQRSRGITPLIVYHLLAQLGETITPDHEEKYNRMSHDTLLRGSMLVAHVLEDHKIGYHQVTGSLTPGTYHLGGRKRLERLSDSVSIADCPPYAFVVPPGVPRRGTVIDEGFEYEIFRVEFPHKASDLEGELTEYSTEVMRRAYDALDLRRI